MTKKRDSRGLDAVALLRRDHETVKGLFKQFSEAGQDEQHGIAELICHMLKVHTQIEEEVFYPAARELLDEMDLVEEAEVEHASAKMLIGNIEAMDPTDDKFEATVTVLCEYVDHHVREEQNELFPKVKRAGMDLQAVGEQLASRRTELMSELGLSDPEDAESNRDGASAGSRKRSSQRSTGQASPRHARSGGKRASAKSASARGGTSRGGGARNRSRSTSGRRSASTR